MKITQTLPITIAASTLCILIGTISKQPLLRRLGEVTALGTISTKVITKQQRLDASQQKQIILLARENTSLENQLSYAENELNQLTKKVKFQDTRNRIYLSHIEKLQHQQKMTSANLAKLEEKLESQTLDNKTFIPSEVSPQKVKNKKLTSKKQSKKQSRKSHKTSQDNSDKYSVKDFAHTQKPVTRVYIDGNNFSFAVESLKIEVDYNALLIELSQNAIATTFKYYTGIHSEITEGQKRFVSYLEDLRYEVIGLPILPRPDSNNFKTVGDDVKIAVDMLGEVKPQDRIILVSGDGDFIPAITKLQGRGVKVTVVAKKSMLSKQLAAIADDVIFLDDIKYTIARHRKLNVA